MAELADALDSGTIAWIKSYAFYQISHKPFKIKAFRDFKLDFQNFKNL